MNDFILLVVVENLKPTAEMQPKSGAWFSIVPVLFRTKLVVAASSQLGVDRREIPFLVTRVATALAFLALASWFAWRASSSAQLDDWLHAAFLTLAWFWLLCPRQNPWYWTWALPLLAFARGRAWMLVSGLVLLYSLRFWLGYHRPDTPVVGSPYAGHAFFDFVVTWIEFAPWFALLLFESCRLRTTRAMSSANIVSFAR